VIVPQTRDVISSAGVSGDGRAAGGPAPRISDLLRAPAGPVDLETMSTSATPGFAGAGKADAQAELASLGDEVALLQKQLFAQGRAGGSRRLLLVLQGMDTSGKGATVEHVLGMVNPMGVRYHAFTRPTIEEREHHFLWRVMRRLPPPGIIGVFDRSHYEDVLVVRVHQLVPPEQWATRYDVINCFEARLSTTTKVVKCFLYISAEEQRKRLLARLDNPKKWWKYQPGDLDDHARWHDYQLAYADVLCRCNAEAAPWYVVPADRKWYRNWAVTRILVEQLRTMGLVWPAPSGWDPETECTRLRELAA
jgi:PPK2 family polyphosphate:nucleotide phosphotransferase